MFVTWPLDPNQSQFPYVIVGSGPAGLYLAERLARTARVLVIETGSLDGKAQPGDSYEIVSSGRDYSTTGTRLAQFGGTSNHWGGNSHPFGPETFEPVAGFGTWPIGYSDLEPYLADAGAFLNLRPFDTQAKSSLESGVLAGYDNLVVRQFQFSMPARRLGDAQAEASFGADTGIMVLTETRVLDIVLTPEGDRVAGLTLLHRPSGERADLPVGRVILCAGGIENARLLLWAGRKYPGGNPLAGGPNRLTGKYFVEKPYIFPVDIYLDATADLSDALPHGTGNSHHAWELSRQFRSKLGLPRFGVFPEQQISIGSDADIAAIEPYYVGGSRKYVKAAPAFQLEQTPHADSYVALADSSDSDGVARARLNWQVLGSDLAAFRKAVLAFCGTLNQRGFARARLHPEFRAEDWSGLYIGFCNHHIGTTRMAASAEEGVVDPDAQVFGLGNLFVAGSSIFSRADYINPTLNLVALAGRLADHLLRT